MFQRIQQYGLIDAGGRWYRPRAYGNPQPDGTWEGWLVFFPLGGGSAIAPGRPETTQSTGGALAFWASGLTPVYLEGALSRAIGVARHVPVISRLTDAEYEALEDAERLETAAEFERTAAGVDELAAEAARVDAEQIRQERLATEGALAAADEAAARMEAKLHESVARDARATAAEAERRRRSAQAEATPRKQRTRRKTKQAGSRKK